AVEREGVRGGSGLYGEGVSAVAEPVSSRTDSGPDGGRERRRTAHAAGGAAEALSVAGVRSRRTLPFPSMKNEERRIENGGRTGVIPHSSFLRSPHGLDPCAKLGVTGDYDSPHLRESPLTLITLS